METEFYYTVKVKLIRFIKADLRTLYCLNHWNKEIS